MRAVLGRSVQIGTGIGAVGHKGGRRRNFGFRAGGANQSFLHFRAAEGVAGQAGYTDAQHGDLAAFTACADRNTDNRETRGWLQVLLIAGAGEAAFHRDNDFADNFIGLQRRSEGIDEKLRRRNFPFLRGADQNDGGFQRLQRRRIIRRRVGVRHTAADSTHVAHLNVANVSRGLGNQRALAH